MAASRKKALDYAERLLSVPRSQVEVVLRQGKGGVSLLHRRRLLTKCYLNRSGMEAAFFMAKALGLSLPPLGSSMKARVSTGLLWRAVSISSLRFGREESYILLERLMGEAEMMRGSGTEAV